MYASNYVPSEVVSEGIHNPYIYKNEINEIIDTDQGMIFVTGLMSKAKIVYKINIHLEFFYGEKYEIDIQQCVDELMNTYDYARLSEKIKVTYTY